jgi:hypothetical protein
VCQQGIAVLYSLDLDQSVQQLSLSVQQYQHFVVQPCLHGTVLRFPWVADGPLALLGRYGTTQGSKQGAEAPAPYTAHVCGWMASPDVVVATITHRLLFKVVQVLCMQTSAASMSPDSRCRTWSGLTVTLVAGLCLVRTWGGLVGHHVSP